MKYRKLTTDQPTENYTFADYCHITKLFCLAAIIIWLTLSACDFREVDAAAETTTKKENNMESLQTETTIYNKIPPIDAAVTTDIETATFAMG